LQHLNSVEPVACQGRGQRGKTVLAPREKRKLCLGVGERLPLGEVRDPPGDALGPVDESDIWPEGGGKLLAQQREVGAGQHHGIDLRPAWLVAQARRGAGIDRRIDRLSAQLGLSGFDQFPRGKS
jgi:hypothetical protein